MSARNKLDGDEILRMLGRTSEDDEVKSLLQLCEITSPPKLKRGDVVVAIPNKDKGIDLSFRDERALDVRKTDYPEGALVLSNVAMYGSGHSTYKQFAGQLPLGLVFTLKPEQAYTKLGKRPTDEDDSNLQRVDFPNYCVFLRFDEKLERLSRVSIQLPVKKGKK